MPNNSFRKVKVDKRSGFDKSFRNTLTGKCGTLIPVLVDEFCPDTIVHLREALAASLPPLVSDTYMNVRLRLEAFVVPHRLCQANYEDFFIDYPVEVGSASTNPVSSSEVNGCMPLIRLNDTAASLTPSGSWGKSTLTDYFGIASFGGDYVFEVPAAPYVAYALIWQEWYRNPRVQKPLFIRGSANISQHYREGSAPVYAVNLPYCSFYFDASAHQPSVHGLLNEGTPDLNPYKLHDGSFITDLRQRNFGLDFFTAALSEPQQGDVAKVKIESDAGVDFFTIASLRAQNSIQQFRERNGLTSPRYQQQIYARYGVAPEDGVIQRPVLIGAATYDVYSHGVTATAENDGDVGVTDNPFGGYLGQRAANGFASGSDFLIEKFHAKEPMYLIVLASLVPEVSYSQVFNPLFLRYIGPGSITDMANGILQNVGPQPIYDGQLHPQSSKANFYNVFAYTDRYSDWMIMNNQVHGEMNEYLSGTLKAFVLQRTFASSPQFGSSFLQIPTDYLDGVTSVTTASMGMTYWLDIAFDYKVSMPIQEYAIPSLQDPGYEHGRTITLRKNGQLL